MNATPSTVPQHVDYLTAGKAYEIVQDFGDAFTFHNDRGGKDLALDQECHHLDGAHWERRG